MDLSDWQCLANSGYNFAVIQAWSGGYGLNSDIGTCISNAYQAGFAHVDVYGFFCPNCDGNNPPNDAISQIVSAVDGTGYGMLWVDVESCEGCWSEDGASNCDYVQSVVSAGQSAGATVAMYSSAYEWSITVGEGCSGMSNLALWYADYDDEENYNDFEAFGGWSSPNIKQFSGDGTACGIDLDQDWYP